LDFGKDEIIPKLFRFEEVWLAKDRFRKMVIASWNNLMLGVQLLPKWCLR